MEGTNVKKRRYNKKNIIRIAVMVICAMVFAVCIVNILKILYEYIESENYYEELNRGFDYSPANVANGFSILPMTGYGAADPLGNYINQKNSPGDIHIEKPSGDYVVLPGNAEFRLMTAKLREYYSQNSDVYGYIQIDDTKISYPIMQGTDNDFYLSHGLNKRYLKVGSIMTDYRNSRTITENRNLIIYGHNMLNGSMFHDLARFDKDLHRDAEAFFRSHDEIVVSTFDGIYTFKIFSFYHTDDEDPYLVINFFSDAEFLEYCNTAIDRSMYNTGISIGKDDIVLTLSTCVNGKPTERYACHAKLVSIQK